MNAPRSREEIDRLIALAPGWQGTVLGKARGLVRQADPEVVEEVNWTRIGDDKLGALVWLHHGILCTSEIEESRVRLIFAKGALLPDPSGLFDTSLEGGIRRSIDLREGDAIDELAFRELIRAAVAFNSALLASKPGRKE